MNYMSRFGSFFAIFEGVALKGLGHVTLNNIFMFSVDRRNPAAVDVFMKPGALGDSSYELLRRISFNGLMHCFMTGSHS